MATVPNPFSKTVKEPWEDNAYATYTAPGFTWLVLKTYQRPDMEDQYSRWFCATQGPGTFGSWELGDGYAKDISGHGTLVAATHEWVEHYGPIVLESLTLGPIDLLTGTVMATGRTF